MKGFRMFFVKRSGETMKLTKTVVLCHGRHVDTVDWETLVWGEGDKIGTAPLALYLAFQKQAQLVFGTGASEKDGLKECAFTQKYLLDNLTNIIAFPEFVDCDAWGYALHVTKYPAHEREALFKPLIDAAHLDFESTDTVSEVKNALKLAQELGADELIQVTSPFHAARCMSISARLLEDGYDFGGVIPMVVSAKSSTSTCRAATTVILEHPHRGDDPMVASPLMPYQVFPRMFRLTPSARMQFFADTSDRLKTLGV